MTGLILASALAQHYGGKVAVIDTERGSASKYADLYSFDVLELANYSPLDYVNAMKMAEGEGYPVVLIDSLSHAWVGKGGALEMVDMAAKKSSSGNSFAAWRDVTPLHNRMVDALTGANLHVIVTMRSKMEYLQTQDDRGRTVIKKVGLQPVQRDGLEYEFDVVADMDLDNNLVVSKTRCPGLAGLIINKPDGSLAEQLHEWLSGEAAPIPQVATSTNGHAAEPPDLSHVPEAYREVVEEAGGYGLDFEHFLSDVLRTKSIEEWEGPGGTPEIATQRLARYLKEKGKK
jgi:hypothetical protein